MPLVGGHPMHRACSDGGYRPVELAAIELWLGRLARLEPLAAAHPVWHRALLFELPWE